MQLLTLNLGPKCSATFQLNRCGCSRYIADTQNFAETSGSTSCTWPTVPPVVSAKSTLRLSKAGSTTPLLHNDPLHRKIGAQCCPLLMTVMASLPCRLALRAFRCPEELLLPTPPSTTFAASEVGLSARDSAMRFQVIVGAMLIDCCKSRPACCLWSSCQAVGLLGHLCKKAGCRVQAHGS